MRFLLSILLSSVLCLAAAGKTIKAGDIIKKLEKGENVEIADAVIEGVLDFSSAGKLSRVNTAMSEARVKGSVFFLRCVFKDAVIAQKSNAYARFDGNLSFLESEFQKEANFSKAVVFGAANFSKSIFRENADFSQMAVWSKNSYFSEISAGKKFSMDGSSFHGSLSFMSAKFAGKFSLQEAAVLENLQSSNASFGGATDFAMLKTGGRAIFRYAAFSQKPNFSESKLAEPPEM